MTTATDQMKMLGSIRAKLNKPKEPTMNDVKEAAAYLTLSNSRAEIAVSNGRLTAGTIG